MKRIGYLLLCGLALVVVGCQDEGPSSPSLAQVSGTVTLDGKPMEGGEVRFLLPGYPPQAYAVQSGAISGQAFVGQNQVEVVWEKDGPPNPMNPETFIKVNVVSPQFSGPNTPFKVDVGPDGASDLKFEVTSARN